MDTEKHKKYYETLGLNSGASKKEINKAFRELSHLYHPDNVVGKPQNIQEIAAKKFNEISQARKVLIDYIEEEIQDDQSFRQHHDYEDDDEYAEDTIDSVLLTVGSYEGATMRVKVVDYANAYDSNLLSDTFTYRDSIVGHGATTLTNSRVGGGYTSTTVAAEDDPVNNVIVTVVVAGVIVAVAVAAVAVVLAVVAAALVIVVSSYT